MGGFKQIESKGKFVPKFTIDVVLKLAKAEIFPVSFILLPRLYFKLTDAIETSGTGKFKTFTTAKAVELLPNRLETTTVKLNRLVDVSPSLANFKARVDWDVVFK